MGIWFAAPIDKFPDYAKVTSTPSGTNINSNFPAANLLTYDPTQVCVATAQTMTITWNFLATQTIDFIALLHTNLTDLATWSIETSPDGVNFTTVLASTSALAHMVAGQTTQNKKNMLRRNACLFSPANPISTPVIRITVNSGSAGILPSIGRLFVGQKFKPATGWQYGSTIDFDDYSQRERTDRGAMILAPQFPIVIANIKMDFLTQQEMMDYIWEFNYWRGSAREILACLDDVNTKWLQKNLIYGTLSEGRRISYEAFNAHSVSWVVEALAA